MEIVYKIIHIPSGLYVSDYTIRTPWRKSSTNDLEASFTKKGRTWKRFCDVLVAWKTIRKQLREASRLDLLQDYVVQDFVLNVSKTYTQAELEEDIKIRDAEYNARQLKYEISRLEWRIKSLKERKNADKAQLTKLQEDLIKLQKK